METQIIRYYELSLLVYVRDSNMNNKIRDEPDDPKRVNSTKNKIPSSPQSDRKDSSFIGFSARAMKQHHLVGWIEFLDGVDS